MFYSLRSMKAACLVVPDFLVALARRDTPGLRGRPVVIGGSPEEHAQVTACSSEAAAAGVTIGTTLRRALALCPNAVFLPLKEALVAEESARIFDHLQLYSPVVEAIAPGHVHFDVRGLARMTGIDEATYLCDLHEAVLSATGLPVRLAAGETVFAAHAAAIHNSRFTIHDSASRPPIDSRQSTVGNPILVPPGGEKMFLADLPVEVLPVSPLMHMRLRLFGLERLGQVAEIPFSAMQAQFGREGAHAWELAHGRDDSRIIPRREELRVTDEMELPAPTALSEPIVVGTRALLQRALNRPEMRAQTLRRLDWRLGLESGEQVARNSSFANPRTTRSACSSWRAARSSGCSWRRQRSPWE